MSGHTPTSDSEHARTVSDPPLKPPGTLNPSEAQANAADSIAVPGAPAAPEVGTEEDIWIGRTSWKHYMGRLLLWIAGNAAFTLLLGWIASGVAWLSGAGVFWISTAAVVLSGMWIVGRIALLVIGHRYRLTSQRLFVERGILSQTIDQTELIRVDDVRVHRSFLDRLFGLGTVAIISTDATDREIQITGIAGSREVAEHIRERMRTMRRKSLFIENL